MRKISTLAIAVAVLMLMPTASSSLLAAGAESATQAPPELKELTDLKQLQDLFNRDKGKPRLVLLVSPT